MSSHAPVSTERQLEASVDTTVPVELSETKPPARRKPGRPKLHSVPPLRDRLIAAAVELTVEQGWAALTMRGLAERIGVSRQTVYNELGSKPELAEAMVLTELATFLEHVETAFADHPTDLADAVEQSSRRVLELCQSHPFHQAVLSASHGADSELLPLYTTHSDLLLGAAQGIVAERLPQYNLNISEDAVHAMVDMVLRMTISHAMRPTDPPAETAARMGWLVRKVIAPE